MKRLNKGTFLTFRLGDEVFAIDVRNVREVLEFTSVTKIPGAPDFVRGIINLRGGVVPVVDLRVKLGMGETARAQNSCVIVLDLEMGDNTVVIGALADSVKEVLEFEAGQVEPPPKIGTLSNSDYIEGIGKRDDLFIIILKIRRVFSTDEIVLLGSAAEEEFTDESEDRANVDSIADIEVEPEP